MERLVGNAASVVILVVSNISAAMSDHLNRIIIRSLGLSYLHLDEIGTHEAWNDQINFHYFTWVSSHVVINIKSYIYVYKIIYIWYLITLFCYLSFHMPILGFLHYSGRGYHKTPCVTIITRALIVAKHFYKIFKKFTNVWLFFKKPAMITKGQPTECHKYVRPFGFNFSYQR